MNKTVNETVSHVCNNLNENTEGSPFSEVKIYKLDNPKNITIGHVNVSSLRNKFISIEKLIKFKLNMSLVSETKIDNSFPNRQLSIDGHKTYLRGRNNFGGGLSFYENENIPRRELTAEEIDSNSQNIFLDIADSKMVDNWTI